MTASICPGVKNLVTRKECNIIWNYYVTEVKYIVPMILLLDTNE